MTTKDLVKMVEELGLQTKTINERWVETKIDDITTLLLTVGEIENNSYCLVVVHKLHNQTTFRQIISMMRSLGFNSPFYISGTYWKCLNITEYTFFEKKDDGKTLQLLTDKIIAKIEKEVNEITELWD
jgi:hypothetical protein